MPKSLFEILRGLRYVGVGAKVTRSIYRFPETYWIISRSEITAHNQSAGRIYGRLVWRGVPKAKDEEITSSYKKEWSVIALPDYGKFKGTAEEVTAMIPPGGKKEEQPK